MGSETYVGVVLTYDEAMAKWANNLGLSEPIELDGSIDVPGFQEGLYIRVPGKDVFETKEGLEGVIVGEQINPRYNCFSETFSSLEIMRQRVQKKLCVLEINKELGIHHFSYDD